MIELGENRRIAIRAGTALLSVVVPPISEAAWIKCLEAMTSVGDHVESGPAVMDLLEQMAVQVDGLPGAESASEKVLKIPLRYRLGLSDALLSVCPEARGMPANEISGEMSIPMDSIWSAREDGKMSCHRDLWHVFQKPSKSLLNNFRRGFPLPRIVRSSDGMQGSVVTLRDPLAARMACAIYDEFILRVCGYALNGMALGADHAAIVDCMDTYHKVIAARMLVGEIEGRRLLRRDPC